MKLKEWNTIRKLANQSGRLFRKMNKEKCPKCKYINRYDKEVMGGMCCCDCRKYKGHFGWGGISDEKYNKQIKQLQEKYGWSEKYGFVDMENKQCCLPRTKRSYTCLTYSCEVTLERHARLLLSPLAKIRDENNLII